MSKFNILHLCSYFGGSSLYDEYFKSLFSAGARFDVVFIRKGFRFFNNKYNKNTANYSFYELSFMPNKIGFFPFMKSVLSYLILRLNRFDLDSYSVVHAHTTFSDGGVAYLINKLHGTPYIITVRNTDLNLYLAKMKRSHWFAKKIINNSSHVIFISPSYKETCRKDFSNIFPDDIKYSVLPNGISEFWFRNSRIKEKIKNNILFVGNETRNKNLEGVIRALDSDMSLCSDVTLSVVGLSEKQYKGFVSSRVFVSFLGRVDDKEKLLDLYSESTCLVVPSFKETFGLVYAEALSTGTPVIYSQNQGFDGWFLDSDIGASVNPEDIISIRNGIRHVIKSSYSPDHLKTCAERFRWSVVTKDVLGIYKKIHG
ncbi:glycosyltransferase family 4 protein [Vibrio breoganii]|uniref:glycosyltransferase family 4 protein n=1 Tax=Vibrio breoganii TaxID=553239 RepID=UPI000C84CF40|nr:glycosyltransferase family 4 protein [Vibrio breoganii]PMG94226.1 hypothetical protein BCU79_12100 [Vibrio breoganii]PMI16111.1 hypothetical protein BCU49_02080 [Vibrio breoganii]TKF85995.1 glycosyltransferase family 4 protein [Vibrio breoganii]